MLAKRTIANELINANEVKDKVSTLILWEKKDYKYSTPLIKILHNLQM